VHLRADWGGVWPALTSMGLCLLHCVHLLWWVLPAAWAYGCRPPAHFVGAACPCTAVAAEAAAELLDELMLAERRRRRRRRGKKSAAGSSQQPGGQPAGRPRDGVDAQSQLGSGAGAKAPAKRKKKKGRKATQKVCDACLGEALQAVVVHLCTPYCTPLLCALAVPLHANSPMRPGGLARPLAAPSSCTPATPCPAGTQA
jgi:hypothetical protein